MYSYRLYKRILFIGILVLLASGWVVLRSLTAASKAIPDATQLLISRTHWIVLALLVLLLTASLIDTRNRIKMAMIGGLAGYAVISLYPRIFPLESLIASRQIEHAIAMQLLALAFLGVALLNLLLFAPDKFERVRLSGALTNILVVLLTAAILVRSFDHLILPAVLDSPHSPLVFNALFATVGLVLTIDFARALYITLKTGSDYYGALAISTIFLLLAAASVQDPNRLSWALPLQTLALLALLWLPQAQVRQLIRPQLELRRSLEESLQKSHQRLQHYKEWVESNQIGFVTADRQGRIVRMNGWMRQKTGMESPDRSFTELLSPTDREVARLQLEKIKSGTSSAWQADLLDADGGHCPALIFGSPLFDAHRHSSGGRFVVVPHLTRSELDRYKVRIDEMQANAEKLKKITATAESKHRRELSLYRSVLDETADLIFVLDKQGRCILMNKSAQQLLGRPPDQVKPRNLPAFMRDLYHLEENSNAPWQIELDDHIAPFSGVRGQTKSYRWSIRRIAIGSPEETLTLCRGVDQEKLWQQENRFHENSSRLENGLQQEIQILQRRLKAAQQLIAADQDWSFDQNLRRIFTRFCHLFCDLGWKSALFMRQESQTEKLTLIASSGMGRNTLAEWREGTAPLLNRLWEQLDEKKRCGPGFILHDAESDKSTSQKQSSTHDYLVPVNGENNVLGFYFALKADSQVTDDEFVQSIAESIAARSRAIIEHKAEYDSARNELKGIDQSSRQQTHFFNTQSHDLRAPLNSILTLTGVLLNGLSGKLNSEQRKQLTVIQRSSETLLARLNTLLDLARLDAGRMEIERSYFVLDELIDDLSAAYTALADARGLRFHLRRDKDLPRFAFGDREKIERVLHNLLSNAVKYTETGSVGLTVKSDKRHNTLRFIIEDSGPGMTSQEIERVLQPFEQNRRRFIRREEGTGLGLSIACQLWDLLGGRMAIDSTRGKGTKISLDLPLTQIQIEPETSASKSPVKQTKHNRHRILVIDDDDDSRYAVQVILEDAGYIVDLAANGKQGIQQAKKAAPDLIYLDMMMPDMSGDEVVKNLRQDKNLRPIAIVAMTAQKEDRSRLKKNGFDDFLPKPFTLKQLLIKTRRWLTEQPGVQNRE
ncbi:response regulator [candidate division KSB1 bacterium]|nr:response regulator [candidate division KSB1 bacterium]